MEPSLDIMRGLNSDISIEYIQRLIYGFVRYRVDIADRLCSTDNEPS